MASTWFVAQFDGKGDFALWRKKIRAILVQQKVAKILDEKNLSESITKDEKKDMNELTYSTILLYLLDNGVLRLVDEATTTRELGFRVQEKAKKPLLDKILTN